MSLYTEAQYTILQWVTIASSSTSLTGSVFMGINILYDHPLLRGSSKGEQILFCMVSVRFAFKAFSLSLVCLHGTSVVAFWQSCLCSPKS